MKVIIRHQKVRFNINFAQKKKKRKKKNDECYLIGGIE